MGKSRVGSFRRGFRGGLNSWGLLATVGGHRVENAESAMGATAQNLTFDTHRLGLESTYCCRFLHDTGWTAVDPKPPFAARETSAARVQVFGPLVRKTASGLLHLQKKPTHAFSSRLSSFRKRQSVFSAMIFCGVDLMNPTSCSRRA